MRPTISFIIPVYNVEKYIHHCLGSILSQNFTDWECLLIDDGSTDNSGIICDEYSKNDSRIIVFHKSNNGVSSARNLGLEKAKGEYIWFVDADDYIMPNSLSILLDYIQKNSFNAIAFGFNKEKSSTEIEIQTMGEKKEYFSQEYLNSLFLQPPCWCYLFKKEIIDKHNLKFVESLKYSEDRVFILIYFALINNISIENNPLYTYVFRENSAINNNNNKIKQASDQANAIIELLKISKDKGINNKVFDYQIRIMVLQFLYGVELYKNDKEYFKIFFHDFTNKVKDLGFNEKWFEDVSKNYNIETSNIKLLHAKLLTPNTYLKELLLHYKMIITHPRYIAGWIKRKLIRNK